MTNILFINGNLNVGGAEMALVNLLNCLDKSKYSIDLLLLQDGYIYENNLAPNINCIKVKIDEGQGAFCKAISKSIKSKNWTSLSFRLVNILASRISPKFFKFIYLGKFLKQEYDYVISFRPGICAYLALYATNSKNKICWWHHGNINQSLKKLDNQLTKFNKVITVSHGVKKMLETYFPNLKCKIGILPNCIDIDVINSRACEYKPYTIKKKDNSLKIITVSRLSAEKNVIRAIEVARCLRSMNATFDWHIIGDGECMQSIKDEILKENLESYIHMEGKQANPYPWIAGADMMVHLSTVESFGLVILEAMCLGVPCIAVESLGAKELINNGNGILTYDNAETIAREVFKLAKDSKLRKTIISKAKSGLDAYEKNISRCFENILKI